MKKMLSAVLGIGIMCSLVLALSAHALASSYTLTGEKAETIKNIFEWSVWNAQGGKNDGKVVYIRVQPRCSRCLAVVKNSAEIAKNVEIRWIFGNRQLEGTGYLHDNPMPGAFMDAVADKTEPETPLQLAKYAYNRACAGLTDRAGLDYKMTPVAIFSTKDGMRVVETSDAKEILRELKKIVPVEDHGQQALPYIEKIVASSSKRLSNFYNTTKKNKTLHILPTEHSPVVSELEPTYGFSNAKDFAAYPAWGQGTYWQDDETWQPFAKK